MNKQTTSNATKPLGVNQAGVLRALVQHHAYFGGCGWTWSTYSQTIRILDSLVARGLAAKTVEFGRETYRPTEQGHAVRHAARPA
jgi:hypothetical protein